MYSRYYRCIAQKKIERGKAQPALSWPKPPPSHTPTMAPHISTSSTHNTPPAAIPLSPISHSRWQPEKREEKGEEKGEEKRKRKRKRRTPLPLLQLAGGALPRHHLAEVGEDKAPWSSSTSRQGEAFPWSISVLEQLRAKLLHLEVFHDMQEE